MQELKSTNPIGYVSFHSADGKLCSRPQKQIALLWHSETPRMWCRETLFIEPKSVSIEGIGMPLDLEWKYILESIPEKETYDIIYTKH
jgi:hypothetical protein